MSKRSTRILALVLALVIFGGGYYIYYYNPFTEEREPPAVTAETAAMSASPATPVTAMIVNTSALQDVISVNGSTIPKEEVMITAEVPGKIKDILFKEGTRVKKGTPLLRLDDSELQAQRERLLVQRELTQKIAERMKNLYDREGVSLQEYEIAAAEAEQVAAELALIDVQLEKRIINAPFSGVLGLKQVSDGSYLSPGSPVISLVSTNPIHLEFSVPEKYSRSIQQGGKVEFTLAGIDHNFEATVIAKEPNIDSETRTLRFKASAPNPKGEILPGAYANVRVNLRSFDAAILIPTQAVVPELGGKKVFLFRNGKAVAVPVETGIREDANIQVIEGLQEGDTIITTGVLQIRSGSDVTISQLTPAGAG